MKPSDVDRLTCVDCGGDLAAENPTVEDGRISSGLLVCAACERAYPVIDEVGIFFRLHELPGYLTPWERERIAALGLGRALDGLPPVAVSAKSDQQKVAEAWEYQHREVLQWETASGGEEFHSETMFRRFIRIAPNDYRGRTVYVACVGRGKEARHALDFGAETVFVNEIGAEAHDIPKVLATDRDRLVVMRCDIKHVPLRPRSVDIAICDHALQHVADHAAGYRALSDTVRPGGKVAVCVYSWENNFLMTHFIEPARKLLLRHLPLKAVRYLALPPAVVLLAAIKLIYVPANKSGVEALRKLPLFEHMIFWSKNEFRFIWSACFDLMHAQISHHFRRAEVQALATANGQKVAVVENTHGTMWSMVAAIPLDGGER